MVEVLVHLILPVIVLLAFRPKLDKVLVFSLAILAVMPDIDVIIGHRTLFHNVFFAVGMSLLAAFAVSLVGAKRQQAFYLSIYYLFSHMFLDLGNPGVPFFYPLSSRLFTVNFSVLISPFRDGFLGSGLSIDSAVITKPIIEAVKPQVMPVVNTFGVLLLVLVAVLLITKFINSKS